MKKIIIITGDPNSINSELLYKCFKKLSPEVKSKIYLISNYELIKKQLKKLKYYINLKKVRNIIFHHYVIAIERLFLIIKKKFTAKL